MEPKTPWAVLAALALSSFAAVAKDSPNILVIIADDCTFSDLPVNGGENAKTPNIDRLASEGLVFDRAYLGMSMCAPCRSELYTGRLAHRNGCAWNHGTSRTGTLSIVQHLGKLGYRVGLAGKSHVKPKSVYPFENVPGFDGNCVRSPTQPHSLDGARSFIRKSDDPFCLVVALTEPHVPWVMGDATAYPPKKLKLPPYLADTPVTRKDFSNYLAEITYMDSQVGELLDLLKTEKHAEDTLVLFTSEQGSQFPGNKWTNWDSGLHTTVIVRWPGVTETGKRTPAVIQYADVLPTFIEAAGGQPEPEMFDGKSFAKVLRGETDTHRDFAYGMHNNFPEGPSYPIRSVTDGEWRYIRNLMPDRLYIEKHLMGRTEHNAYWQTWVFNSFQNEDTLRLVERYMQRPAEQLYHTAEDRFEMTNLADDPAHAEVKQRLIAALEKKMAEQGDPGKELDTPESYRAAADGKPRFDSKP
ncbi:heparan N-sulfatase [Haloferula helveola]|uniref:Heparan N-sulfatase n=1 Tax=Haloferula helveola TaxID=490095 RepID=A0ABM7RGU4_9BACT|nr:heparan N-sulfatase [Haloferula helveola]